MRNKRLRLVFLPFMILALVGFVISCQKGINWELGNRSNGTAKQPVKASVSGLVLDENGLPVTGATVKAKGGYTTTTNAKGYFRFNNITLDKYASYISVQSAGYFNGNRVFTASAKGVNFIKIKLKKRQLTGSFTSSTGGVINSGAHSVSFQASSFVLKNGGAPYSGVVNVFIQEVDPTDLEISSIVPGNFLAIDSLGNRVLMKSFGMLLVELEGSSGEALQLAPGKPATISYTIPSALLTSAPVSIPMWYFDEIDGIWKQEGRAIKVADKYSGQVSHFTPWNFDLSFRDFITLEFTLKSPSGSPVPNTLVKTTAINVLGMQVDLDFYAYSDSTGYVLMMIPANSALTIQILDECYQVVYTRQEGPKSANTDLGDISFDPNINKLQISGVVKDCNGQPVVSGYVSIYLENKFYNIPITANGQFSVMLLRCYGSTISMTAVDLGAQRSSDVYNYNLPFNLTNLSLVACANQLYTYNVTTVAGSPGSGYLDGAGVNAKFFGTCGIVLDASGNLFVSDASNNCIRKISPAGIVSTFAGSTTPGHVDATGTAARFNVPLDMTSDNNGNLYVTDYNNHVIRKITPAGQVTTVAGDPNNPGYQDGPAATARFSAIEGIAYSSTGDLYVADDGCNCIRKISSAGVVSTLAGSNQFGFADGPGATAKFASPMGLAFDNSGNLLVADFANERIRKITPSGLVSTLSGTGVNGYLDGAASMAQFSSPMGVKVDATGNIFIGDAGNHKIRRISAAGMVTTIAGSTVGFADGLATAAQFYYPYYFAIDPTGIIYVTDNSNHAVRKLTPQ